MSSDGLVLNATLLELTGITAALHVAAGRSTLELVRPTGELLFFASVTELQLPCMRAAWRIANRPAAAVLAVGTALGPNDDDLPRLAFSQRRGRVSGRLTRLGPFWLAEAAGARLSVTVDDGRLRMTTRPRRRPGPLRFRIDPARRPAARR